MTVGAVTILAFRDKINTLNLISNIQYNYCNFYIIEFTFVVAVSGGEKKATATLFLVNINKYKHNKRDKQMLNSIHPKKMCVQF